MSSGGHHIKLALGDTVKVRFKDDSKNTKNQNRGIIDFFGSVEDHKGTWFGVSFKAIVGKNDGTYKNRKYFECKPKHGSFIQHQQIIKIVSKAKYKHSIRIQYNSSIKIPGYGSGKVRFAGIVSFNPGIWYGIELDSPHPPSTPSSSSSYSDSTVAGIQYFHCASGYALFQRKQDLCALLMAEEDIVTQKNIKPSLAERTSNNSHDGHKKHNKHHKKIKGIIMKRAISEPINGHSSSNSDHSVEIKDYQHNDHSNETKEEDDTQPYDYEVELKLALNDNRSDEIYAGDVDEKRNHSDTKNKLQINNAIMIVESDTSDIDDNVASSEEERKVPKMKKMLKSKSVPPKKYKPRSESEPAQMQPRSIYAKNLNICAYIDHLNDVASQRSPKAYNRPHSKSIKHLKNAFQKACINNNNNNNNNQHTHNTGKTTGSQLANNSHFKINVSSNKDNEVKLGWKQHSTPVRFGSLSLEYSEDEAPVMNAGLDVTTASFSKSMPFGPTKATTNPPEPINISQSARASLERDRALTFPTMALNTDNATKISAATPHQQSFKVVLIGQSRCGKTSIIRRFVKDKFHSQYKMTLGAAQWHFKCEVPIDLIEEVTTDTNMMRSMNSFLDQVQEENENIKQIVPNSGALGAISSADPFDEQDENCEFGAAYDYGSVASDDYKLSNMDESLDNIFDWRAHNNASMHASHGSKSITDYGQFTVPEVNEITKDTRKVSMKLQISLDIVDMGFHPTEEELLDDVNAIILVVDITKKSSISDAIDKYESYCHNSKYFKPKPKKKGRKKMKRHRSRSGSNPRGSALHEIEREYIPLIIAINKCEIKKTKKQFKTRDLKRMITKKLEPIISEHFPEPQEEEALIVNDVNHNEDDNDDDDDSSNGPKRRPRNFANTTLLAPPNLSFIYNEDGNGSDSEYESEEEQEEEDNLLQVHSDPEDSFNTPRNPHTAAVRRRKKKSSKKKKIKKRDKSDIRYIDIIQCSAKTGKNIEKLFGRCIKKTIPSKLTKSVSHKRTKTTAHVTAPIWLRQVVAEFEKEPSNENHPFWDMSPNANDVDDNFTFLGDDYASDY